MDVYQKLKEDIIKGKYEPGSVFVEKDYASELNVSRTPVREAVLRLANEGYINIIPRKGTLISSISFEDIKSIYEYRMILEPESILLLKDKKIDTSWIDGWIDKFSSKNENNSLSEDDDKKFHVELAKLTGNKYIYSQIDSIMDKCSRIRILSNFESSVRYKESMNEHIEILKCLKNKDVSKASEMMKVHLINTIAGFSFIG